jgi:pyridoxine kinase
VTAVLAVTSQVVAGHVGAGAAAPALAADGIACWTLPTVVLSGHAATPGVQGRRLPGEEIAALARGLEAAGALARADALLMGYLGAESAAEAAADLAERFRALRPEAPALVDPVLGDEGPGLYLPEAVGRIYRERLLPLADIAAPNRFELGWLTDRSVDTAREILAAAEALRALGPRVVHVTSVPAPDGRIGVLTATESGAWLSAAPRLPVRLNGAGDFAAARLLAGNLEGLAPQEAAAQTVGAAQALAEAAAAAGRDDLPVVEAGAIWRAAPAAAAEPIGQTSRRPSR